MKKVSGTSAFILIAFFVMGKSGNSTLSPFTLEFLMPQVKLIMVLNPTGYCLAPIKNGNSS